MNITGKCTQGSPTKCCFFFFFKSIVLLKKSSMQEVVVTLLHYDIHPTLCFLSGDECELIGGRQGHVWRCGPPRELHAGQWVHSDEGIGRAQPQQSDLYPPPQPEASDGIRSASLPRWVETQDNKRHTCAYERHILEAIQGWEMTAVLHCLKFSCIAWLWLVWRFAFTDLCQTIAMKDY